MEEPSHPERAAGQPARSGPVPDPVEALADLESRAAAWSREERAAEVLDRAVEAYRGVTLASRFVASLGRRVALDLGRAGQLRGLLAAAGDGWVLLDDAPAVLVLTGSLRAVTGLADGAAAPAAWPPESRRSVASMLQREVQTGADLQVTSVDGARRRGRGVRVGADFVELRADDGSAVLVPSSDLAVVRRT